MDKHKILDELHLLIWADPCNIIDRVSRQIDDQYEQMAGHDVHLLALRMWREIDKVIRPVRSIRDNRLAIEITRIKYER